MENNIIIKKFSHEQFGDIRTVSLDGDIGFNLHDICMSLGYTRKSKGKEYLRKDNIETKCGTLSLEALSLTDNALVKVKKEMDFENLYIFEDGLYDLALDSRAKHAREFRKWITQDVLPALRKTGMYIADSSKLVEMYFGELQPHQKQLVKSLFDNIENQNKKIKELDIENELLSKDVLKWPEKKLLNALIKSYGGAMADYGKAWVDFKKEMLYRYGICINSRLTAQKKKNKKAKTLDTLNNDEVILGIKTITSIIRESNKNINKILLSKLDLIEEKMNTDDKVLEFRKCDKKKLCKCECLLREKYDFSDIAVTPNISDEDLEKVIEIILEE